jgi:hypothetical protein
MSETSKIEDSSSAPACTPNWDTNDPHQQEVSRILSSFQNDIMGVISLGKDGIMRSLTGDRRVLSAEAFCTIDLEWPVVLKVANHATAPNLVKAMLDRLPSDYRATSNQDLEDADGTKTSREKWFNPDEGILPPPLPQEKYDQVKNKSAEEKEVLRKMVRESEKYAVFSHDKIDANNMRAGTLTRVEC